MIRRLLMAASMYGAALAAGNAADLAVTVNGIKSGAGSVIATVFDSEKSFLNRSEALASLRLRARPGQLSFTLRDLPPGKYAAVAFHDQNDNGKLDFDPSGQPTEIYGFSNGAREPGGPPKFADAAFEVGSQIKTIKIEMAY
jgi:uncharacterized protein (DUF2141 family)